MPRSRRAPRGQRLPIRSRPVSGGGSESGVALIVVLWLIVLLTLLASAAATLSVTHRRSLERYGETVRERALEDSAIRLTVLRLLAAKEPERARLLSRPQKVTVLDSVVAVTVTREAGRVDLNTSDSLMLLALFSANGLQSSNAELLRQRIVSWRGTDRNGPPSSLPRTPFESISELREALGADTLSPEITDAFTVYSHLALPVAAAAPPSVQRALSWADKEELGGHRWLNEELALKPPPVSADLSSPLAGEVLRVSACLSDPPAALCRLAIVRPTDSARGPFEVFAWKSTHEF